MASLAKLIMILILGERVFEDLSATYWMIGLALIGACILSFVWIILMRFLASLMVWLSIAIVFLGTGSGLGYSGWRYVPIRTQNIKH